MHGKLYQIRELLECPQAVRAALSIGAGVLDFSLAKLPVHEDADLPGRIDGYEVSRSESEPPGNGELNLPVDRGIIQLSQLPISVVAAEATDKGLVFGQFGEIIRLHCSVQQSPLF